MPLTRTSIPELVGELARRQPDAAAYTFVDYDVDPAGLRETLTWSQVHQRTLAVAAELATHGAPGDRVAILAPQGLDYVIGLLGALAGGFVAVPLPAPQFGVHDERVAGALRDCAPVVVLTTSAAAGDTASAIRSAGLAPDLIELDALDLHPPDGFSTPATPATRPALLQYTSGSTGAPAGVAVTHRNIVANLEQVSADLFEHAGKVPPPEMTVVLWLPFYHDLGLQFGMFFPIVHGLHAVIMAPIAFLAKPARWMQLLASYPKTFSGAPNFAFDLAARRTTDDDLAGLDLGDVLSIASGAERVQPGTLRRFTERFARFHLPDTVPRPGYGLAEATVYVTSTAMGRAPVTARFDYDKLSAGHAERCAEGGVELVGNGVPRACTLRIVDPEERTEKPAGQVGEIWVHGENVTKGYWQNPQRTEQVFGGRLVDPSPGTPDEPWLRSGDLGVIVDDDLFIVGRIKDLLIIDGRNHYPDDIESTVSAITRGRSAAVAIADQDRERLVAIAEVKTADGADAAARLDETKLEVASAISRTHGLRADDLVLVAPGSLPITTSGKIRRSACAERYRQNGFTRLDG